MEEHEILRGGRVALGLRQVWFAKALGVTGSYLSHLESGRRPVTLELLSRLPKPIRDRLIDARMTALDKMR